MPATNEREMLRHTLATVAYRGRKALVGAPRGFQNLRINETSRTPGEILSHICDLYAWANWMVRGKWTWKNSKPTTWSRDVNRFFSELKKLDAYLASNKPLGNPVEIVFQGPIADSLEHIGQIAYLRRVGGAPVRGESYARADIKIGKVGIKQSPPRFEFD
jgi:hypothetical protein